MGSRDFLWLSQSGGSSRDYCNTLLSDNSNYLYLIGNFDNNFAFETDTVISDSIANANPEDIFIARFYDCDLAETITFNPTDTTFCDYGQLHAQDGFKYYKWSNDRKRQHITIYDSEYYWVQAVDKHNCFIRSDSTFINIASNPQIALGPDRFVTNNEIVELYGGNFEEYLWSNGDTTQILYILTDTLQIGENIFSLTATNEHDCSETKDIGVYVEGTPDYGTPPPTGNSGSNVNNENIVNYGNSGNKSKSRNNENSKMINSQEFIVQETMVYPNPSKGDFTVSLTNIQIEEDAYLEIITEDGKILKTKKINTKNNQIDMHLYNKGVFIINIYSNNIKYTEKIVIE